MRRLVYAPKVWIFIRSSNINGIIFDVSEDIVRGSVTQNLNDLSSANFELRNRYQKWVRDRNNGFRSIFLPMDLVTIWMQRIAGKPVQVFTGYLDEVPYYQAYPGNAIFKASCTLKKLAFNWFDPGLFTFMNWFKDNSEWSWDPNTGSATPGPPDVEGVRQSNDPSDPFKKQAINDSGLGKLLAQFMVDIAGWDPHDIIIDKLDARIAGKAAELYAQIESGIEVNIKETARLLKEYLSVNGVTGYQHKPIEAKTNDYKDRGTGSYFSEDEAGNTVVAPAAIEIVEAVMRAAGAANVSPTMMIFFGIVMSNLDPNYEQGIGSTSNWGFGLYAMRPNTGSAANPGAVVPAEDDDLASLSIDKHPLLDVYDPATATAILSARLNSARAQGPWLAKARGGDIEAMLDWLKAALGRGAPTNVNFGLAWADALALSATEVSLDPAKQEVPSAAAAGANLTFSEPSIQARMSMIERSVAAEHYVNSNQALIVPTWLGAKAVSSKLRLGALNGLRANEIFIVGPPRELEVFYNRITGDARYEAVEARIGGEMKALAYGRPTQVGGGGLERVGGGVGSDWEGVIAALAPIVDVIDTLAGIGAQPRDRLINTPRGEEFINKQVRAATGEGATSFLQLAAFSANAAFGANFAFNTDLIKAHVLTGHKALMNDTSCLDAVKQFTQASMRAFRSLPDGRFLAFYPDYFSAKRKPYWKIEDIEIIDFGIQLNDSSLATHVYVVGDHFHGTDTYLNDVASRGVATITHAGIVDTMINWGSQGSGPGHRLKSGWAFIKHFGARPHKYEADSQGGGAPYIRNAMYEFLLAWQQFMLLWAQQFATICTFTFMPEVMAGGVIEFGKPHGVQMFCNRVTHNFDYAAGFTTQAEMMAPALAHSATKRDLRNFPGMALAGGTNTLGVGLG